jgi:hypothetical protein
MLGLELKETGMGVDPKQLPNWFSPCKNGTLEHQDDCDVCPPVIFHDS